MALRQVYRYDTQRRITATRETQPSASRPPSVLARACSRPRVRVRESASPSPRVRVRESESASPSPRVRVRESESASSSPRVRVRESESASKCMNKQKIITTNNSADAMSHAPRTRRHSRRLRRTCLISSAKSGRVNCSRLAHLSARIARTWTQQASRWLPSPFDVSIAHKQAETQRRRDAETQRRRGAETQRRRGAEAQRRRDAETQGRRGSKKKPNNSPQSN